MNGSRSTIGDITDEKLRDQTRGMIGYAENGQEMDNSRRTIGYYEGV